MSGLNKLDKYNIGVITYPFTDMVGETITKKFVKILEPLVKKLYLITGQFSYTSEKVHVIKIKTIKSMDSLPMRPFKYILTQLNITFRLVKICKNVDIVIFFLGARSHTLPLLTAKLLRKKIIMVLTGMTKKQARAIYSRNLVRDKMGIFFASVSRVFEKINFTVSDIIVVESHNIISDHGLFNLGTKIHACALGIDIKQFKIKNSVIKCKNLVGYIGRLNIEKGVLNFVKAMSIALKYQQDIEFLIGGDGPLRNEIEDKLKKNDLCYNKVKLTGWIPHDKLPDYFNELKLIILPSYTEGLPNIVLEAMACGTLVLATPVGGISDLIKDGETGFIMENNSPECIAENVMRALNHSNLDKIVKNARELMEKEFTYAATVERYRKILESI